MVTRLTLAGRFFDPAFLSKHFSTTGYFPQITLPPTMSTTPSEKEVRRFDLLLETKVKTELNAQLAELDLSLEQLFTVPLFLYHEDPERYFGIRAAVSDAVQPKDAFELFWAQNIAEDMFEAQRWRRLSSPAIENEIHLGLQKILKRVVGTKKRARLVRGCRRGDAETRKEVIDVLERHGYDESSIQAEALLRRLEGIGRFSGMLDRAQNRVQSAAREIHRHRDIVARRLGELGKSVSRGSDRSGE